MALAAIELQDVTIRMKDQKILQNVHLSVACGESIVVIGPSGHGKTTLIKMMAGLLRPSEGRVLIFGEDLYAASVARRQKLIAKMGMLFQKNALFDSLNCAENIAFSLRETTNQNEIEIQQNVDKYLDSVGILKAKNLFVDEISGGMQKRLGIARALALCPEIVFYDDPTAGLDPITSRKIAELIINFKKQSNSTQVVITNDLKRAFQLADRMFMVVDGQVINGGTTKEILLHSDSRVQKFIGRSA